MALVTLAQAKAHLRLIEDDEDTYVEGLIAAATAHIETVCGDEFDAASAAQNQAALLIIGQWFDNRDEAVMPPAANALLRPFMLAFETHPVRINFSHDYDYTPSGERRVTIAYKAGTTETVKREAGEAAIAAGAGVEIAPFNGAPLEKVDHDGDGRPGGARKAAD